MCLGFSPSSSISHSNVNRVGGEDLEDDPFEGHRFLKQFRSFKFFNQVSFTVLVICSEYCFFSLTK